MFARHMLSGKSLTIQIKSRITFARKYRGKDLYIGLARALGALCPGIEFMRTVIAVFALAMIATPVMADPRRDLLAADRAFARMSLEKGYDEAYLAFLAEDGQTFTGPRPIRNGADAVSRYADPKGVHNDHRIKITWAPDTGDVSADGTLGWTEGRGHHKGRASIPPTTI